MIATAPGPEIRAMRTALLLLLAGACLLPAGEPADKPVGPLSLRVASVQMRSTRNLDDNVKHTIDLLKKCAADKIDVAVFPECSVSGYFSDTIAKLSAKDLSRAEGELCRTCRELGVWAVVGMPQRLEGKLFNSAVVIDDAGKV